MAHRFTQEDADRMQARVNGRVQEAIETVRAILPVSFVVLGNAMSLNNGRTSFVHDGKMVTVNKKEYADWKKSMTDQIRKQWGIMLTYDKEVFVIYDIHRVNNRVDYANPAKAIDDALQDAGVIKNDNLIRRGTITKHVDKHRPRVEIHIYPSTLSPL